MEDASASGDHPNASPVSNIFSDEESTGAETETDVLSELSDSGIPSPTKQRQRSSLGPSTGAAAAAGGGGVKVDGVTWEMDPSEEQSGPVGADLFEDDGGGLYRADGSEADDDDLQKDAATTEGARRWARLAAAVPVGDTLKADRARLFDSLDIHSKGSLMLGVLIHGIERILAVSIVYDVISRGRGRKQRVTGTRAWAGGERREEKNGSRGLQLRRDPTPVLSECSLFPDPLPLWVN